MPRETPDSCGDLSGRDVLGTSLKFGTTHAFAEGYGAVGNVVPPRSTAIRTNALSLLFLAGRLEADVIAVKLQATRLGYVGRFE
jgi:hypothetical protein